MNRCVSVSGHHAHPQAHPRACTMYIERLGTLSATDLSVSMYGICMCRQQYVVARIATVRCRGHARLLRDLCCAICAGLQDPICRRIQARAARSYEMLRREILCGSSRSRCCTMAHPSLPSPLRPSRRSGAVTTPAPIPYLHRRSVAKSLLFMIDHLEELLDALRECFPAACVSLPGDDHPDIGQPLAAFIRQSVQQLPPCGHCHCGVRRRVGPRDPTPLCSRAGLLSRPRRAALLAPELRPVVQEAGLLGAQGRRVPQLAHGML